MKTSVLITIYNRPEHLRLCLQALSTQTHRPDGVIIADDGSDAATVSRMQEFINTFPFSVRVVRQEHDGYRLAAARNLAIRAATGEYLISIDCDIALLPDTIEIHLRNARPRRFLVGNRALLGETESRLLFAGTPTVADWEAAWQQADQSPVRNAEELFQAQARLRRWHLARRHKPKLLGCHFSLFKSAMEEINGFDENYTGWGYEDDDFAMRLYKAGLKSKSLIALARALHLYHPTLQPATSRHRDRPNRAYFRRWRVAPFCLKGLVQNKIQ